MSDLFELPESPLPPLEAARRELAAYEKEMDDARKVWGLTPIQMVYNWEALRAKVGRLEQEAMRK